MANYLRLLARGVRHHGSTSALKRSTIDVPSRNIGPPLMLQLAHFNLLKLVVSSFKRSVGHQLRSKRKRQLDFSVKRLVMSAGVYLLQDDRRSPHGARVLRQFC